MEAENNRLLSFLQYQYPGTAVFMSVYAPLLHSRQCHSLQVKVILTLAAPHLLHISKLYTYSSESFIEIQNETHLAARSQEILLEMSFQHYSKAMIESTLEGSCHLLFTWVMVITLRSQFSHLLEGLALPLQCQEIPIIFSLIYQTNYPLV